MKNLITLLWLFFIIILYSCNSSGGNNNHKNADLKGKILGFWIAPGEPSGFHIGNDSIYYAEEFKSYKYTLTEGDTLIINFDGYINKSKVIMNHIDTLIVIGQDTTYYIRSK